MTTTEILLHIKAAPNLQDYYNLIVRLKEVKTQFDQLEFNRRADVFNHCDIIDELWKLSGDLVQMTSLFNSSTIEKLEDSRMVLWNLRKQFPKIHDDKFHNYLDDLLAELDATIELKKLVDQLPSITDVMAVWDDIP